MDKARLEAIKAMRISNTPLKVDNIRLIDVIGELVMAIEASEKMKVCPFCLEDDFDLPGLKYHLLFCEKHQQTEKIW
jgi:hypothetical protein